VTAMSHVCSHDLFIHNTRQIHCDVINVIIIICQITLIGHGYSSRLTCHSPLLGYLRRLVSRSRTETSSVSPHGRKQVTRVSSCFVPTRKGPKSKKIRIPSPLLTSWEKKASWKRSTSRIETIRITDRRQRQSRGRTTVTSTREKEDSAQF
jgi:hypothetical protein